MELNIHLECFAMTKDLKDNRKDKVSSFILPEILVKLIHYLLENALTDFS